MSSYNSPNIGQTLNNYAKLNTIPALLSIFFAMASLYAFGGVAELHFSWFDYTLTVEHATLGSMFIMAVAFASSETRDFDHYARWEQVMIAMAPILILGAEYVDFISQAFVDHDPLLGMVAFGITVAAWGVAIR
jgi:hypothetical protein